MNDVALLVVSCDRYADLWPYFFALLRRQWSDCPFSVFLGSNFLTTAEPGVTSIAVGPDTSWSTGVRRMLDRLTEARPGTEYVLLMLEDFLLTAPVDSGRVVDLAAAVRQHEVGYLRLAADLPLAIAPQSQLPHLNGVGSIESGAPYRITLQAALWRISTLRALLAPGMTPWDFETIGSQISETRRDQLWGVTSTVLHYDHVLEKGKWKPDGLRILREAHLPLPGNGRPAFSEDEFASYREQGEMDAKRSAQRGKALRYFLKGRRREGLRALCGYVRATGPGVSEVALGVAGMIGPVATRGLLAVYVASRLRDCARRERDEMSAKSGDPR